MPAKLSGRRGAWAAWGPHAGGSRARGRAHLAQWPPAVSHAWPAAWQGCSVRSGTPAASAKPREVSEVLIPALAPPCGLPPTPTPPSHHDVESLGLLLLASSPASLPSPRVRAGGLEGLGGGAGLEGVEHVPVFRCHHLQQGLQCGLQSLAHLGRGQHQGRKKWGRSEGQEGLVGRKGAWRPLPPGSRGPGLCPRPEPGCSYLLRLDGLSVQAALDILGSGQNLIPQLHLHPDLGHLCRAACRAPRLSPGPEAGARGGGRPRAGPQHFSPTDIRALTPTAALLIRARGRKRAECLAADEWKSKSSTSIRGDVTQPQKRVAPRLMGATRGAGGDLENILLSERSRPQKAHITRAHCHGRSRRGKARHRKETSGCGGLGQGVRGGCFMGPGFLSGGRRVLPRAHGDGCITRRIVQNTWDGALQLGELHGR